MRKFSKKTIVLMVSLALLLCVGVGGTLAFLMDVTGDITNIFTPSKVTTFVQESFEDGVKSDVKIQNTGDTTAYIRAAVVVTWKDAANGNVYGELPVEVTSDKPNGDYTIEHNVSKEQGADRWIKGEDGFYYWTSPVLSDDEDPNNCTTGVLIKNCKALTTKTIGTGADAVTYHLSVEIIGSGIQYVPAKAVLESWNSGVSAVGDNGTLTIKVPSSGT